jgi:outer membrane lipoprotein-sorting protein
MKMVRLVLMILLVLGLSVGIAAAKTDVEKILRTIDAQSTFPGNDFASTMTMISEDPEKGLEKRVVRIFRRDKEDKFLLLIQEPEVQKGQGYLRLDDNLWFYDPDSRKFSHTSMKESFGGTDAKNSDFSAKSLADDYNEVSCTEGKLGNYDVYIIELKAVNNEVTYPYLKLWVSKNPNLIMKSEEYSLSNRRHWPPMPKPCHHL